MKPKIILTVLLLIFVFYIPSKALAMTEQERQTLIVQIQQQLVVLQTQLAQMLAQQQGGCHTFTFNLGYANSGSSEIGYLHADLQAEGISHNPDGTNIYALGTYNAVVQFQARYGITQTGYVGPLTRSKLNQLYGCACTPSWQTGAWGTCVNGQQTRTVTDSNSCGVTTNKPATTQSCTAKQIDIKINNSDGPINTFLTLGNGATVNGSGFTLTESFNLQWTGTDVSSCMATDTITPTVFSGYKTSSGSQTVTVSGTIQGSSNKVTNIFKLSCISTLTGSQVSDTLTVNLYYTVSASCTPSWQCTNWSTCTSSHHTRTCADYNGCGSLAGKPAETESCVMVPVVDIKAGGLDTPTTILSGSSVSLSWTSSNVTSCTASGGWTGTKSTNGSQTVSPVSSATYTITCTGTGGTTSDSVTVSISSPTPTIDIEADSSDGPVSVASGISVFLSWLSTNSTSCEASGGWTGTKSTNGSESIIPTASSATYTMTCVGDGGSASDSVVINRTCTPSWQPVVWGACINGQQTGTVVDSNNCGVTTGQPATTRSCTTACVLTDVYEQTDAIGYRHVYILVNNLPSGNNYTITGAGTWDGTGFTVQTRNADGSAVLVGNQTFNATGAAYIIAQEPTLALKDYSGNTVCSPVGTVGLMNVQSDALASIAGAIMRIFAEIQAMLNQ